MAASQNWGHWFRTLDLLNANRAHSFSKEFRYGSGKIFSDCADCGSTLDGTYSKETGPFNFRESQFVTCELEAKVNAAKKEVR
jgi:hypothetical protein